MSLPMLRQPAGLSSDTLDPPTSQRHALPDDQWSAHDTVESDDERDVMEESVDHQPDLTIQAGKLSPTKDKTHEVGSPSPTAPSPTAAQDGTGHEADTGSVHSLPAVQVSEHSNMNGPMTSRSASAAYPASPTASLAPTVTSSLDRRSRHRATLDVSVLPESHPTSADRNRPVRQIVYLVSSQTSYIGGTTHHRRRTSNRRPLCRLRRSHLVNRLPWPLVPLPHHPPCRPRPSQTWVSRSPLSHPTCRRLTLARRHAAAHFSSLTTSCYAMHKDSTSFL